MASRDGLSAMMQLLQMQNTDAERKSRDAETRENHAWMRQEREQQRRDALRAKAWEVWFHVGASYQAAANAAQRGETEKANLFLRQAAAEMKAGGLSTGGLKSGLTADSLRVKKAALDQVYDWYARGGKDQLKNSSNITESLEGTAKANTAFAKVFTGHPEIVGFITALHNNPDREKDIYEQAKAELDAEASGNGRGGKMEMPEADASAQEAIARAQAWTSIDPQDFVNHYIETADHGAFLGNEEAAYESPPQRLLGTVDGKQVGINPSSHAGYITDSEGGRYAVPTADAPQSDKESIQSFDDNPRHRTEMDKAARVYRPAPVVQQAPPTTPASSPVAAAPVAPRPQNVAPVVHRSKAKDLFEGPRGDVVYHALKEAYLTHGTDGAHEAVVKASREFGIKPSEFYDAAEEAGALVPEGSKPKVVNQRWAPIPYTRVNTDG